MSNKRRILWWACVWSAARCVSAGEPLVLNVWEGPPPGPQPELPAEADLTKPEDPLIAGRRIIKLGNVTTPQLAIYRPSPEKDTGTSVIICPGGGFHILAYDLEGTEVAEWLNELGITGIVLKYRVPFREAEHRGRAGLQDAQRALSLVRTHAAEWRLDPARVGILGFSAGGNIAGHTVFYQGQRHYEPRDAVDTASCAPDFAILIYAAGFLDGTTGRLRDGLELTAPPPPLFLVHTWDDFVDARNPLELAAAWKRAKGAAELHLFSEGGHGYGLRPVESLPVTRWPALCAAWLKKSCLLEKRREDTPSSK